MAKDYAPPPQLPHLTLSPVKTLPYLQWILYPKSKAFPSWTLQTLVLLKSKYCLANVSATKAPIIMKFETYAHKVQWSTKIFFLKIHAHTRTHKAYVCIQVLSIRQYFIT